MPLMMSTLARTARPTTGAYAWFGLMVGTWLAFAVLAVTSEEALDRIWDWVRDLPLVLELVVWLLTFPWLLALAVWESAWSDTARVLVVLAIATAWTLMSIPRPRKP
jgi:hypothetical protein